MRITALLFSIPVLLFSLIFVPAVVFAQDAPAAAPPATAAQPTPAAMPNGAPSSGVADSTQSYGKDGLQKVSSDKWDWAKQWAIMIDGVANMAGCSAIAVPFNTDACPVTVLAANPDPDGDGTVFTPTTMLAYHGEGGGFIAAGSRAMAYMYTERPASGTEYIARAIDTKFGLEPQSAYAQVSGSGAAVIKPVERLWQLSRNIAYLFFIFIFLTIGFMIMFRQKLNPQTVISVQNALPGLIVGLILVTFSFFLAGLIIDLAFFLPQILGGLLLQQTGVSGAAASADIQTTMDTKNLFGMFFGVVNVGDVWNTGSSLSDSTFELINGTIIGSLLPIIGGFAACLNPIGFSLIGAATFTGGPLGAGAAIATCGAIGYGAVAAGGNVILNAAIFIIVLFGLLQALARLFFQIISAYVTIMIMTIFGPIYILLSTIPGNSAMFSNWWRVMLANTLLFPAIFLLFVLVRVILTLDPVGTTSADVYGHTLPLLAGLPASFMQLILAYGILLASPALAGLLKDILKAKINSPFLTAAGKNLKTGYAFGGAAGGAAGIMAYKGLGGGLEAAGRIIPSASTRYRAVNWPINTFKEFSSRLGKAGFRGSKPAEKK